MDADRRRILEWLEANAPALAPVYDGAVRMILEPEFPGRVHFIAHAMREIMNLWMEIQRGGERRAHVNLKKPTPEGPLQERFKNLETLLKALSTRSYEDMDRIDEILDATYN